MAKAEVFEKRAFEQTNPLNEEMKGAFPLNNLLAGTVRPPHELQK